MSRDPAQLQREALRILAETRRDFPQYKAALDRVQIRLSSRLTRSAGNADPRSGVVQLSEPIFRVEENAEGYRNTVLHEIAHIIAGPDVRAHGPEWRDIFIEIGGDGRRTHNFRAAREHRTHPARCGKCGGDVELGTRRFHRLLRGARDYIHVGCGGTILPEEVSEKPRGAVPARVGAVSGSEPARELLSALCSRCGQPVRVGPIRLRRLVGGERTYRHRKCGGEIVVELASESTGKKDSPSKGPASKGPASKDPVSKDPVSGPDPSRDDPPGFEQGRLFD